MLNTEHIEEYFNLTGRPIATMTVDEYIKLISIPCNNDSKINPSQFTKNEERPIENKPIENTPKHSIKVLKEKETVKTSASPEEHRKDLETVIEDKIARAKRMLSSVEG